MVLQAILLLALLGIVASGQSSLDVILVRSGLTPEVTTAVQLAAEHVNTSPNVDLRGYTLNVTVREVMCNHRSAQNVFFETLQTYQDQVAVVGADCSEATIGLAETARLFDIPMLSYSSTSQELEVRRNFPNVFRTVPSDRSITSGIAAFIATHQWSRVVVLSQDTEEYKLETIELVKQLQERNLNVTTSLLLPERLNLPTPDSLFPSDHRIFVLNMGPSAARFVLCEAIKMDLERFQYVWILQGSYPDHWWRKTDGINCSSTDLARFLRKEGAIAISFHPLLFNSTTPSDITGIAPQNLSESVGSTSPSIYYAYDAILVLAKGLNQTLSQINVSAGLRDVVDEVRRGVISSLNEFEPIQGVSGKIEFENGTRVITTVSVHQYRDCGVSTCLSPVGTISLARNGSTVEFIQGESKEGLWRGDVPSDGTPITVHRFHSLWLVITSYIFSSLVIVGALVSMIFTCVFRNRKLVRLTSPNMNLVIALGVITFNIGVYLFVYPPVSDQVLEVFCALRSWVVSIGLSLCFGTVNAKMWRIYYIFRNPNPAKRKRPLMDWHLLLIVMGFVLLDIILLTFVSIFETARLVDTRVPDVERPPTVDEEGITVLYEVTLCEAPTRLIWLSILFGYKIIIQGIGLFLALKIRNVKIKVLNDSKEIAATLYLTSAILAVVIVISVALSTRLDVYSAAYSFGIPLSTTFVLIIVFFTKMYRLCRDPQGEKIFIQAHTMTSGPMNLTVGGTGDTEDDRVSTLQRQVRALQMDLAKYRAQGTAVDVESGSVELNKTAETLMFDNSAVESPSTSRRECEEPHALNNGSLTDSHAPVESKQSSGTVETRQNGKNGELVESKQNGGVVKSTQNGGVVENGGPVENTQNGGSVESSQLNGELAGDKGNGKLPEGKQNGEVVKSTQSS